jgi:hypothetical protein
LPSSVRLLGISGFGIITRNMTMNVFFVGRLEYGEGLQNNVVSNDTGVPTGQ